MAEIALADDEPKFLEDERFDATLIPLRAKDA